LKIIAQVRPPGPPERADAPARCLVLGRHVSPPLGNGRDQTSLVFSLPDQPGALQGALETFAAHGVNLANLESRPARPPAAGYYFFLDCIGHWQDAKVAEAVAALRRAAPFVKWLGSYPNTGPG
jgi:prephenate dehydratase